MVLRATMYHCMVVCLVFAISLTEAHRGHSGTHHSHSEEPHHSKEAEQLEEKFGHFGSISLIRPSPPPRKIFIFNGERYTNWSDWSECLATECIEVRQRTCLDDSWKKPEVDAIRSSVCPTKYVAEKRPCLDRTKCNSYVGAQMLANLTKVCGIRPNKAEVETKIVGGEVTTPHSWPWAVRLSVVPPGRRPITFCGATLIAPQWLVTAAHCLLVENKRLPIGRPIRLADHMRSTIIAHLGDHHRGKMEAPQKDYRAVIAILPQKYHRKLTDDGYDIALIRLAKPVNTSSEIDFLCLPQRNMTAPVGSKCFAAGWGDNKAGRASTFDDLDNLLASLFVPFSFSFSTPFKSRHSGRRRERTPQQSALELHEVEVPIRPIGECGKYHSELNEDLHVCAGIKGKDTCPGDSGGGLYCQFPDSERWYLHGVTSFGVTRGCGVLPGVYTSAAGHLDWIVEQITKFRY